MEIQSRGMCRADGKVYEKLVVSGLGEQNTLGIIVDPRLVSSPLHARMVELDNENNERVFVAVCDIPYGRTGSYVAAEINPDGRALSTEVRTLDFKHAKWESRVNYRVNRALCEQIRCCDKNLTDDGKASLAIKYVIPNTTHILCRCVYRLPDELSDNIRVICVNDALETVSEEYVPMGTSSVELSGGCGKALEAHFTVRVPWNQNVVHIYAWDAERPGLLASETMTRERTDLLVSEANERLYSNAGTDPYYSEWFSRQRVTPHEVELQRSVTFPEMPKFSIIVPLFRTPARLFTEMFESVLKQSYQNWELVLVNASPEIDELRRQVEDACARDGRVLCVPLKDNLGISENTNAGIAAATGDFIGFFDHDDIIEPNLLFEYVRAINEHPDTDLLYCDEDKIDESGSLSAPFFKTDFSIDELRSSNYVCHLLCIRRTLLEQLAPNTSEFDGAQDHNLTLEASEKARHIHHVPRVLYHWRVTANSTAGNANSKPYASEAGKRAVQAHLDRMGIRAKVSLSNRPFTYVVHYLPPDNNPLVSVVIPTSDHSNMLEPCVRSILEKTTYANYEIILVDNNSREKATEACYERLVELGGGRVRVERFNGTFNFSSIVNFGASRSRGEYLLLLNNDTRVITPEWMSRMLGISTREEVGAVGCRLYYPDETTQHAGIVVSGMGAGHLFLDFPRGSHGYFNLADTQRALSAVTAACMMVRRNVFDEVGGFDEELAVAYNDVDFCLKLREKNLLVVYTPEVELYHYESISRGSENNAEKVRRYHRELTLLLHRWSDFYADGDPYYTPELQPTLPNCCYYQF